VDYVTVKWLHILSSTLLFGTGIGSAFYMLFASLSRDPSVAYFVVRHVVIADWIFTATSLVAQPLTGLYLAHLAQMSLTSRWLLWSTILYLVAGVCWLPVVWIQMRMRDLAREAMTGKGTLPALYFRYLRAWIALGIPAFFALVGAFYLMVAKPS
jgi:uncharacterized membrane protein